MKTKGDNMNIAILGYGVVGSGVAQLLTENGASYAQRSTQPAMQLKHILDKRSFPGDEHETIITSEFGVILNDPSVGIVAECMGGATFAYDCVLACLQAGKSVVTSNKELVAAKGYELMQAAKANNANFLFEASVAGGIPVIRPLSQCLAANHICEVAGILNGTTNFILTRMIEDGTAFADALAQAQELGYAEADPTADVEGHDACRKLCILATLAYGKHVYPEQVHTEGITKITAEDVEYAAAFKHNIKLLGRAQQLDDGRISLVVAPMLVPRSHMIAHVKDVYNAVLIRGDAVGDVMFHGRGAGSMPTASAVVADIIDCAKHCERRRVFDWLPNDPAFVAPANEECVRLYVRASGDAALPSAETIAQSNGEVVFITSRGKYGETIAKLAAFDVKTVLRVAEFEAC